MNVLAKTLMPFEEIKNEGPILLFLHGFPDDKNIWQGQIETLKKHFHILNFNLPLSKNRKAFRTEKILETLKRKILEYPQKEVFLIGHDLGSFLLEELGQRIPNLINGQILISGMGLPQYVSRKYSPLQLIKSWYVLLFQLPVTAKIASKIMGSGEAWLYQEIPKGLPKIREQKSNTRTLFIFGKKDPFLNPPDDKEASKFYNNFQIKILEGAHWIQKEKLKEVNDLIIDFLTAEEEELINV